MPVSPTQILTALDSKRQDFNQFNRTIQQDLQRYRRVWRQLTQSSLAAVEAGLPPGRIGGTAPRTLSRGEAGGGALWSTVGQPGG
jgi:hypothetical protein